MIIKLTHITVHRLMDSILNIGINDKVISRIEAWTSGNIRFAMDIYRHFLYMFGTIILKIDNVLFDNIIKEEMAASAVVSPNNFTAESLTTIVEKFKLLGHFPEDPIVQLRMAIQHIYLNWYSKKYV